MANMVSEIGMVSSEEVQRQSYFLVSTGHGRVNESLDWDVVSPPGPEVTLCSPFNHGRGPFVPNCRHPTLIHL